MFHMFQLAGKLLPESRAAWAEAGAFARIMLAQQDAGDIVRQ
jgi:hypothetical protein